MSGTNVYRENQKIEGEGRLQVGGDDATKIAHILTGSVTLNFPSAAALGDAAVTATAEIAGLTTSHRVFLNQSSWATATHLSIVAAVPTAAGVVGATAVNYSSAGAIDPTAIAFNYIAVKHD